MLYKFKSIAAADVIMLQHDAERILQIIGKEPGAQGIITADQIPQAIAKLHLAVEHDEDHLVHHDANGTPPNEDAGAGGDAVQLRQRVVPFIALLEESAAAGKDVVWGV